MIFGIVLHYNTFTKTRSSQAKMIRQHAAQSDLPFVICGDMNDASLSYAYHSLSDNLNDAFLCGGKGIAETHDNIKAGLRIDYIFSNKTLKPLDFNINRVSFSDHHCLRSAFAILQ